MSIKSLIFCIFIVDQNISFMPKPYPSETKKAFIKRCVSIVIKEGKPAPQAVAICNSIYDNRKV